MADSDFTQFCCASIEGVVKSWEREQESEDDGVILWPSSFPRCHTDFDRVCCLMALQPVTEFRPLPVCKSPACRSSQKSDSQANKLRSHGNQAFRDNQICAALRFYTRALFYAFGNEEKALAFANRSCVLARLGAHSAVLEDISQAFKHEYPADKHCKLLIRQAQSLLSLNRLSKAKSEFLRARSFLPGGSSAKLNHLIEVGLGDCEARLAVANPKPMDPPPPLYVRHPGPPLEWNPENYEEANSDISGFEIHHESGEAGWHLVAKKLFNPGDLIFLDNPFARRLHRDCLYDYCYRCFRRSINPVPCRGCSEVGFCSVRCEADAWQLDWSLEPIASVVPSSGHNRPCHRFECGQVRRLSIDDYAGWKWLKSKSEAHTASLPVKRFCERLKKVPVDLCVGGPSVSLLSFACIARTPPHALATLIQGSASVTKPSTPPLLAISGRREFPACGVRVDQFSAVGWLASNSDKRTLCDLWQRTVAAVFLTHCLSIGGYPIDWGDNYLLHPSECPPMCDDSELPASWVAACLLHLIQAVASNAHTISFSGHISKPTQPDIPSNLLSSSCGIRLEDVFRSDVGSGLYPLSSLLNHSCNPNVFHVHMADGVFGLYALRVIRPNEMLFDSYGYHYAVHPLIERRQHLLEQYRFVCKCEACSQNWPTNILVDQIRCSRCDRVTTINGSTGTLKACECPPHVTKSVMAKYRRLRRQLETVSSSVALECSKVSFHQLSQSTLDKFIAKASRLLGPDELERVLVRPSFAFDYTQELIKLLLGLRYGCCFAELDGLRRS